MAVDYDELVKNGVDIAGAINEVFLNKFSASHHKTVPDVYEGRQRFSQFDNDVEIQFKVSTPITFDFSPIRDTKFRKLWVSHLIAKGASPVLAGRYSDTPPNLKLYCDEVLFKVIIYDGHSNTVVLSVDFEWGLEAIAAVILTGSVLQLQPMRVSFSTGSTIVASEISARVREITTSRKLPSKPLHPVTFGDPTDPVWCAKLEQMILLLLNQVLATQISNFIKSWELPRAIEVADGIGIAPTYVAIHGDDLVVGAQVVTMPIGPSVLQVQLDALIEEFTDRADKEFSALSDEELRVWRPDHSPTLEWIGNYARSVEDKVLHELKASREKKLVRFDPNLQILFNDKLFDVLAKRFLSISTGWRGSKELDRLLKAEAGWWFRVTNARATVIASGVQVNADVSVGGDAKVCHFDVDPKSFGKWKCYGIGVELYPVPDFGLQVLPSFAADGAYISARLLTTGIGARLPNWPGWANDILGWVVGNLTRPLLSAVAAVIALFRIRVLRYPHHFPGTGLEWTPNFNQTPTNIGPYLVFSADPDFE